MNKEIISDKQGISIAAMFITGSTLILGTGLQAQNDVWLAIIVGVFLSIPALLIYCRLLYLYPCKNLFEITEEVLGKYIGKVVNILYIWFGLHLGALVLRNYGEFIITVAMPETPMFVVMAVFVFIAVWAIKLGIETIGRWAEFFLIIALTFTVMIAFLIIPQMRPENLKPILYNGLKPVFWGGFSVFSFPFAETVILTMVFSGLKQKSSSYKIFFTGLIISAIVILYVSIRNIMVMGAETVGSMYFPSYAAISRMNVGNFLQRLEITSAVILTIASFTKMSMCFLGACNGIKALFGLKDYRFYVTMVGILMLILAYIIYDNIMEMQEWAFMVWPYYAFLFQAILPVIIYIAAEIKVRAKAKQDNSA